MTKPCFSVRTIGSPKPLLSALMTLQGLLCLQMNGGEEVATRSRVGGNSTRARSEWAHSGVFSSDEEEAAPGARSRASQLGDARSAKAARSKAPTRQVRQLSG